ncbi:fumarate hydratase [Desulfococcaceae bacterium HSG9]|nr:fumarate hydratase [Desulfococcaceae bacterium HSG9]
MSITVSDLTLTRFYSIHTLILPAMMMSLTAGHIYLVMFYPAHGVSALKKFVIDTVFETGANPCPPGIIGVGIGGTADLV